MAVVPRPDTMRMSSTCAEERAARSAASGVPTFQRFCRQALVICQEPGLRMHSGPSRSSSSASVSVPLMAVAKAVPSAAPGTPQPRPHTVMVRPSTVICRVGLMRKKLKITSSTQVNTLIRPGVRASPQERSMEE